MFYQSAFVALVLVGSAAAVAADTAKIEINKDTGELHIKATTGSAVRVEGVFSLPGVSDVEKALGKAEEDVVALYAAVGTAQSQMSELVQCCDAVKESTLCVGPSVEVKNGECVGKVDAAVLERIDALEKWRQSLDVQMAAVEKEVEVVEEEAGQRLASHNASFVGFKKEVFADFEDVEKTLKEQKKKLAKMAYCAHYTKIVVNITNDKLHQTRDAVEGTKFSDDEINQFRGTMSKRAMVFKCGTCTNYILHDKPFNAVGQTCNGEKLSECGTQADGPFVTGHYGGHCLHFGIDCWMASTGEFQSTDKFFGAIYNDNNGNGCNCRTGNGDMAADEVTDRNDLRGYLAILNYQEPECIQ